MKIAVPDRALYLRTIWSELSRIHSHLLWLGLMADGFGFENLFMHSWRLREKILDIIEETTGGRVIFGSCKVGGVRKDIDKDTLKRILTDLEKYQQEIKEITDIFLTDNSVKHRLVGVGILSKKNAHELGAVGPTLPASGIAQDMRQLGYAAYGQINFEPITATEGDSFARCEVRIKELFQSIDLIRQCIAKIPNGPIETKVTGFPSGEFFARTEQPRGEVLYYLKANGTKNLERLRVRTPTFANIPAMLNIIPGSDLADVPVLVLTIDPCISCTER
jgi:ech hydrogenase subunit E